MKPVVSAFNAWSCTVLSVFAIVILSILAGLYRSGHEEFTGGVGDPDDGKAVSGTIFMAVLVYVVCIFGANPSQEPVTPWFFSAFLQEFKS
ncbi:hypothetical protein FZEAL_7020 [Fusarium zealandicum]|uniref:Uncharacterized protein n=1 Tax=Fusarium zealandicum TaxID=1053134 RepID=A0A8H4UHH3_9HYPO|nr:hypothetical protein FZEAL_7020 [Fusarium zealandicum]